MPYLMHASDSNYSYNKIKHKEEVNNYYYNEGYTQLHRAVTEKDHNCMRNILSNSTIDINTRYKTLRITALYIAAAKNDLIAIEILLEHNANPFLKCKNGLTAYDIASSNQAKNILSDAMESYKNKYHQTPEETSSESYDSSDEFQDKYSESESENEIKITPEVYL